jgi:hypothetical protein
MAPRSPSILMIRSLGKNFKFKLSNGGIIYSFCSNLVTNEFYPVTVT